MHATTDHESQIDLCGRTDDELAEMKRHYYGNISTVDEKLGEILDALQERGWLENSLLIFCSDHGEMLGDHGLAYKWLMYDPIVHIPLMIRTPKSVHQPGETRDLVSLMDLGPTILRRCGGSCSDLFGGALFDAVFEWGDARAAKIRFLRG